MAEKEIRDLRGLSIFTVIDIGLDKSNVIEKYLSNENIIKADQIDESLDLLLLGILNICKPIKRFGDMSFDEPSSKELLGCINNVQLNSY